MSPRLERRPVNPPSVADLNEISITFLTLSILVAHILSENQLGVMTVRRLNRTILATILALSTASAPLAAQAAPADGACWGQATKVFAQMGVMGEHARGFETPRLGLRNLARALYEQDVIEADSMQALGAFVASALGLNIDACQ
jgi:hypothetical protein